MPTTAVEFRFAESDAARFLPPGAGRRLGDSVRRVDSSPDEPLFDLIRENARTSPRGSFVYWDIRRRYSHAELARAELFTWVIDARFEPTGEECGTVYEWSGDCRRCRTGRVQRSELVLDLAAVPRKDVALSLGGEIVVSERFADLLTSERLTGFELRPVRHVRARPRRPPIPRFQLVPVGPGVTVAEPPTAFGIDPFDPDRHGTYRCERCHVSGLNRLSEVSVRAATWVGADVTASIEHVGNPRGVEGSVLYPEPILLISPRLQQLLAAERITGSRVEVAYLV